MKSIEKSPKKLSPRKVLMQILKEDSEEFLDVKPKQEVVEYKGNLPFKVVTVSPRDKQLLNDSISLPVIKRNQTFDSPKVIVKKGMTPSGQSGVVSQKSLSPIFKSGNKGSNEKIIKPAEAGGGFLSIVPSNRASIVDGFNNPDKNSENISKYEEPKA